MGAHRARQASTVGKIAGRGAFTAAAALALAGGTASFAFADEAPSFDNTASTVEDVVSGTVESAEELPGTEVPTTVKGGEEFVGGHASAVQHDVNRITSALTSDLQTHANDAGVPVGSHATDTEQEISGAVNEVTGQVHDGTGAGAQSIDDAVESGSSMLSFS